MSDAPPTTTPENSVVEICCNVDDCSGEIIADTIEQLMNAGAIDAWITPGIGRKGRPLQIISLLSHAQDVKQLAHTLLQHTGSIGCRYRPWQRITAERRISSVSTPYGDVRIKQSSLDNQPLQAKPEYEDCAQLARKHNKPVREIIQSALTSYYTQN